MYCQDIKCKNTFLYITNINIILYPLAVHAYLFKVNLGAVKTSKHVEYHRCTNQYACLNNSHIKQNFQNQLHMNNLQESTHTYKAPTNSSLWPAVWAHCRVAIAEWPLPSSMRKIGEPWLGRFRAKGSHFLWAFLLSSRLGQKTHQKHFRAIEGGKSNWGQKNPPLMFWTYRPCIPCSSFTIHQQYITYMPYFTKHW